MAEEWKVAAQTEVLAEDIDGAVIRNTLDVYPKSPMQFEKDCIDKDNAALAYYQSYGAQHCEHVFIVANILSEQRKPYEAACLYGLCYRLHSKNALQYPTPAMLLQLRLLCFLKAGKDLPEHDTQALAALCPAYMRYIDTMRKTWRGEEDLRSALRSMGSAFEEFISGEECDSLYLEQARQVQPSLFEKHGQSGALTKAIPDTMFLYWDENPPPHIVENIYFHQGIPDLEVKVFNQESAADWLYNFYGKEAKSLFLSLGHAVEAADFFKIHITHTYGGWWLNSALRLAGEHGLEFVLKEQNDIVLFLTPQSTVDAAFYGTIPNSRFMQDCLLQLYENCYRHTNLIQAYKTGRGVFNRALSRRAYRQLEGVQSLETIQFYTTDTLHGLVQEAPL